MKNKGVTIRYNTTVDDIITSQKQYKIVYSNQQEDVFDGVLVTTPHKSLNWFGQDEHLITFKTMDSTTVATVVLAFDEKDIENTHDGTGFVIARTSDTDITACTWTSKKWPFTTPGR